MTKEQMKKEAISRIRDTLQFYADPEHFSDHPNIGKVELNAHGTWKFGQSARETLTLLEYLE